MRARRTDVHAQTGAIELTGEDDDFGDFEAADVELGVFVQQPTELSQARPAAADAADGQMGMEPPVFGPETEFPKRLLDLIVQGHHLLPATADTEPERPRPFGVREGPGTEDLQLERFHLGGALPDRFTHPSDLARGYVAEEFERQVEVVRLHPFHVDRSGAEFPDQLLGTVPNGRTDLHGDEGANGMFHGRGEGFGGWGLGAPPLHSKVSLSVPR